VINLLDIRYRIARKYFCRAWLSGRAAVFVDRGSRVRLANV
jgi:hypothetical protein